MHGEKNPKKKVNDIYYKYISYENINKIWNIVRKTCKNKKGVHRFSVNQCTNIYNIYLSLLNGIYKPMPFKIFMIFEPKPRLVMSQCVADKIVNHFVANYYLIPYLESKLIDSNVATRKGKGSNYAEKLIKDYINEIRIKNPNKDIYTLKIDISKYFYNINHERLIIKLEKYIDDKKVIDLIKNILNETNKDYVNNEVVRLNKKYGTNIPEYKHGVGLSIGAMTSQFLAIFYLNDLDHFIKVDLKCKYYIRYMDDFLIFDVNKEKLKNIFEIIKIKLEEERLDVNPKSSITNLKYGISFVGYKYAIKEKHFKQKYKSKTICKINKKLKALRKNDILKYYKSYGSYYGYLNKVKARERNFKMKSLEKYNYYKSKYLKYIVLIKEGSFYKTYNEDAIIIWNFFNYKWYKDHIAFSVSSSMKVFDYLTELGIGYIVIDEEELLNNGNEELYDLYLKISNIKYDEFKRKNEVFSLVERLIKKGRIKEIEESLKKLEVVYEGK